MFLRSTLGIVVKPVVEETTQRNFNPFHVYFHNVGGLEVVGRVETQNRVGSLRWRNEEIVKDGELQGIICVAGSNKEAECIFSLVTLGNTLEIDPFLG